MFPSVEFVLRFEFFWSTLRRWHELDNITSKVRDDGHKMSGKRFGRKRSWPRSRYCRSICLEDVRDLDVDLGFVG
jgi:hypothetical protein